MPEQQLPRDSEQQFQERLESQDQMHILRFQHILLVKQNHFRHHRCALDLIQTEAKCIYLRLDQSIYLIQYRLTQVVALFQFAILRRHEVFTKF